MTKFKAFTDGQTKRVYYQQPFNCECGREYSLVNSLMITPVLKQTMYGIGSKTKNGLHVKFADYDEKDRFSLDEIKAELKRVQQESFLSHWFVFQRPGKKSFHAINPSLHDLSKTYEIIKKLSVDAAFMNAPKFYQGRQWILGVTEKGERPQMVLKAIVKSDCEKGLVSNAHINFLEKFYKVPKLQYGKYDRYKTLPLIRYKTGNRLK